MFLMTRSCCSKRLSISFVKSRWSFWNSPIVIDLISSILTRCLFNSVSSLSCNAALIIVSYCEYLPLLETAFLLQINGGLNLVSFFGEKLEDLALLLHAAILLGVEIVISTSDDLIDRRKLLIQRLDAVLTLLGQLSFEELHPFVSLPDFLVLVGGLLVELFS